MKRAIIIVLDSVGIGVLPDASLYHDEGSNTLVNIKKAVPSLHLPNLCRLGLGNIDGEEISILGSVSTPEGIFGKMAEASAGKDTTTGHWEIAGILTEKPFPTFTDTGFPKEIMTAFEQAIGRKTLGNYAASGTEIINLLGEEHVRTGFPIVYTSADSVFQIAAHEKVIPLQELYEICQKARTILTGDYSVARVIARPFTGQSGNYTRTKNRKDFSLAPGAPTLLDFAKQQGLTVAAIGKIEDIFHGQGITVAEHTTNNPDGIKKTIDYLKKDFSGILFTNLVDFDMIYGHRNDPSGYAEALEYFDSHLPLILDELKPEDLLFITADHGCDPTTESTDHSREYVPILAIGSSLRQNINLGTRKTYADLAATIAEYLNLGTDFGASSFLKEIKK